MKNSNLILFLSRQRNLPTCAFTKPRQVVDYNQLPKTMLGVASSIVARTDGDDVNAQRLLLACTSGLINVTTTAMFTNDGEDDDDTMRMLLPLSSSSPSSSSTSTYCCCHCTLLVRLVFFLLPIPAHILTVQGPDQTTLNAAEHKKVRSAN